MAEAGADFDATLIGNMGRKISQYSMEIVELRKRVQELQRGAVYSLVDEDNPHLKGLNVRLGDLEHERDTLNVRLGELEKEKDDLNIRLREMEKEREGFKCDLEKSNHVTNEARRERYAFENELRRVLEQKTKLEMDLLEAQEQVREKNVLKEDLQRVLTEKIDLEKVIHEAEEQLKEKNVLRGNTSSLQAALNECLSELTKSISDMQNLRNEKETLDATVASLTTRVQKLDRDNSKLNKMKILLLSDLDERIQRMKAMQQVREDMEKLKVTHDELAEQNRRLMEENEALSRQMSEHESLAAKNSEAAAVSEVAMAQLRQENEALSCQVSEHKFLAAKNAEAAALTEVAMIKLQGDNKALSLQITEHKSLAEKDNEAAEAAKVAMTKLGEENVALRKQLSDLEDLARQKQDRLDSREQELDSIRQQKEALVAQLSDLHAEVVQKDGRIVDLQNQLDATPQMNTPVKENTGRLPSEAAPVLETVAATPNNDEQSSREVTNCPVRFIHVLPPQITPVGAPSDGRGRMFPLAGSYISPIPAGRLAQFETLQVVGPPLNHAGDMPDFSDGIAHFTKVELNKALGGSKKGLVTSIPKDKQGLYPLSYLGITSYLCPRLDRNPWCPYAPGKDGYIFTASERDLAALAQSKQRALFVNVSHLSTTTKLFFAGFYEVCQAEDLSSEEWCTFTDDTKVAYSQIVKDRVPECSHLSIREIKAQYNSGARRVSCLRLRFLGFRNPQNPTRDVYQALLSHFAGQHAPSFTYKRKSEDQVGTSRKPKSARLSLPES
ncbi:hypothetical protein GLOTRDRAFT_119272 [Gloeophyllum trabeum ATCC 11539]|uniref:DUF6697 domain-containing protein n=1 Tax=Gloeophyllum trabeum (strain ATCC 11539 / FP-39264 / Madison 617) TaxID=670483 RepID=S7QGA7_GLOTA|nr:uncharacterized protein GLOTRDRAFT_119272 [Gloeophyllum trabeum ATCC 11539]EPQ58926.1 hypothetical protein GLOTRDRAFT_119272 [Gloeophyllum trabeum ATCC 11539]